jgi:hypothetical protein
MAMGRNPDRTILLEFGQLRPFSDIYGRHVIKLNNSTQMRQALALRLKTAGCEANLDGTDWHDAGNFQKLPVKLGNPPARSNPAEEKHSEASLSEFLSSIEDQKNQSQVDKLNKLIYALQNFHSNPEGIYYIGQILLECETVLADLNQFTPVERVILNLISGIDQDRQQGFSPLIPIGEVRELIRHLRQVRSEFEARISYN